MRLEHWIPISVSILTAVVALSLFYEQVRAGREADARRAAAAWLASCHTVLQLAKQYSAVHLSLRPLLEDYNRVSRAVARTAQSSTSSDEHAQRDAVEQAAFRDRKRLEIDNTQALLLAIEKDLVDAEERVRSAELEMFGIGKPTRLIGAMALMTEEVLATRSRRAGTDLPLDTDSLHSRLLEIRGELRSVGPWLRRIRSHG